MNGVAAAARRVEASGELVAMRGKRGLRIRHASGEPRFGKDETQEQRIVGGRVAQQIHHVFGALPIEKKICVGAEQIRITAVEYQRRLEMRLGIDVFSAARGDFGGERISPRLQTGIRGGASRKCPHQRAICLGRGAGKARRPGGACRRDKLVRNGGEPSAIALRLRIAALHRQDRRAREQRLAIGGARSDDPVEVIERAVKIVRGLLQCRAQHENRRWCIVGGPPGRQRRLRLSEKPRVTCRASRLDGTACYGRGQRWICGRPRQCPSLTLQ
jgi:hypothetical protein